MVNGSCRVVVFSPPMATAVFGGLTHATPGDVLSSHRASELTGSGGCPCASTYGGDATRERVKGSVGMILPTTVGRKSAFVDRSLAKGCIRAPLRLYQWFENAPARHHLRSTRERSLGLAPPHPQ